MVGKTYAELINLLI